MNRVLVAMSGGVDSSVTAFLLKNQGYECIGATMRLYGNEAAGHHRHAACCSIDDIEDAREVASRLGIVHHVFNFTADFEQQVIDRFVASYEEGATPNPCIDCNRYLKFDRLYRRAADLGCDFVATGHYARIAADAATGRRMLLRGIDSAKDQSYVLYRLTQRQAARTLLPLGSMSKGEVRRIADEQGFSNARKPESQDICFVPDGDYAAFIERREGRASPRGPIVDEDGRFLGEHEGIIRYTIGQRRGLAVSAASPLYVIGKDAGSNSIIVGPRDRTRSSAVIADDATWVSGRAPAEPIRVQVRIRYHGELQQALVAPEHEGRLLIVFDDGVRDAAPGQAAVFYQGDAVLGGGVIVRGIR